MHRLTEGGCHMVGLICLFEHRCLTNNYASVFFFGEVIASLTGSYL